MSTRAYLIFDERAIEFNDSDKAVCYTFSHSDGEAREDARDFPASRCYSYKMVGESLLDERLEWDYVDGKFTNYNGDPAIQCTCRVCGDPVYSKKHHSCECPKCGAINIDFGTKHVCSRKGMRCHGRE